MPRRLTPILLASVIVAGVSVGCSSSHAGASCATVLGKLAPVTNRGSERATGSTIVVDGANAGFTPTCITDVPRGVVTLTLRNTGLSLHDIAVPAQHVRADAPAGKTATIRVRVGARPVVFVCTYHRYLGMAGVLLPAG